MTDLDKLKSMTAWDSDPALTEDELDDLLACACLTDTGGYAPVDPDWSPTYDLNAAAAAGWLISRRGSATVTETDPSGGVTAKVFENCRAMARIYTAKRAVCISTKT